MHSKHLIHRTGSALLLTLLVVSLLLVLTLALSVTVRMQLREAVQRQQLYQAQANARLSLNLAISQIQRHAGADKRVTCTAALAGSSAQPHWTGVWASDPADSTWTGDPGDPEKAVWLVSGTGTPGPDMSLDPDDSVRLVPPDQSTTGSKEVRVPIETMPVGGAPGWIGWWVGDEGTKARVDIESSTYNAGDTALRKKIQSETPSGPDLPMLGAPWTSEHGSSWRERLVSRDSMEMSAADIPMDTLLHDVTVHGVGLPVNVKEGGLKADWSVVLDQTMENTTLVDHYIGATPTLVGSPMYASSTHTFTNKLDPFFLSSRIGSGVNPRPGPNMGTLWHYGRLWQDAQTASVPLTGLYPRVETEMRLENWLPYKSVNEGFFKNDIQHINTSISPLLSHFRFGIRLVTEETTIEVDDGTGGTTTESGYAVQLELKPLIGLWNPYNVAIASRDYRFESHLTPMVRIRVTTPGGPAGGQEYTSFMREIWSGSGSEMDGRRHYWLQLKTNTVDFQPGEVRLFSVDTVINQSNKSNISSITLAPNWSADGYILVDFRSVGSGALTIPADAEIEVLDVYLQDTQHPRAHQSDTYDWLTEDHAMSWITLKEVSPSGELVLSRITGLWNGGRANESASSSDFTFPKPKSGGFPALTAAALNGSPEHLATWSFHLRTTEGMDNPKQQTRGWIDTDPRAPVTTTYWDGDREYGTQPPEGWYLMEPFIGDGPANRGLAVNEEPSSEGNAGRSNLYLGKSVNSTGDGVTHLPLFDIPTAPLVSVGQFQHAQIGRYSFEPAFVIGNSYANVRIPLEKTVSTNHNGLSGFNLYDISYDVNERIWDRIFFSTLAPDYVGATNWGSDLEDHLDSLPNPRMIYNPGNDAESIANLLAPSNPDRDRGAEALAARIRILGAFNINSTSVTAWKAVLSTMATAKLPVISSSGTLSWEDQDGIRFNRFGHVLSETPYESGQTNHEGFWQGWRKLSAQDLDDLAVAMVEEVRARGPFRNMADFVNRDPESSDLAHQRKGALQAALDRTVNLRGAGIDSSVGDVAEEPSGSRYDQDAFDGESTSAGFASYLLQGDVLQSLAPILSARSDTFTIRAYGAIGPEDAIAAKAWCEAVVQREADYVDETDEPWRNPTDDSLNDLNTHFGRQLKIVSFRWLEPDEVEGSL